MQACVIKVTCKPVLWRACDRLWHKKINHLHNPVDIAGGLGGKANICFLLFNIVSSIKYTCSWSPVRKPLYIMWMYISICILFGSGRVSLVSSCPLQVSSSLLSSLLWRLLFLLSYFLYLVLFLFLFSLILRFSMSWWSLSMPWVITLRWHCKRGWGCNHYIYIHIPVLDTHCLMHLNVSVTCTTSSRGCYGQCLVHCVRGARPIKIPHTGDTESLDRCGS